MAGSTVRGASRSEAWVKVQPVQRDEQAVPCPDLTCVSPGALLRRVFASRGP
ncbi:hypothetical protein ACWGJ2_23445 [Streptomyces sp. NPDC054796]